MQSPIMVSWHPDAAVGESCLAKAPRLLSHLNELWQTLYYQVDHHNYGVGAKD